jgi:hypothetical protein
MSNIVIPSIILRHPSIYLFDGERYDILGCILCHLGYSLPEKSKSPADLKTVIPPFTVSYRRTYFDTPLTLSILKLDFVPSPREAVRQAGVLLAPHGITLEYSVM